MVESDSSNAPRRSRLPEQLIGGRFINELDTHVRRLRSQDAHGNRKLFLDDVFIAHLLAFYNPVVRSLRLIEDLSQTPLARRHLSVNRIARSTLGDFQSACDPTLLEPLLQDLYARLPKHQRPTGELGAVLQRIVAVDASFFNALADVSWAIGKRRSNGKPDAAVLLHLVLDTDTHHPLHAAIAAAEISPADHAALHLQPGAIHLLDRGYVSFSLLNTMLERHADFVLRLTTQTRFCAAEQAPLNKEDRDAGVISDQIGTLGGCSQSSPPKVPLRLVCIANAKDPDKPLRLLTNLRELTAAQIGWLYRQRWQIELFFRWLKVHANFHRLLSHSRNGVALSFHVALIGVVLMCLATARPPSLYAIVLLGQCADGSTTLADILPILAERQRQSDLAAASQRRRRARKS